MVGNLCQTPPPSDSLDQRAVNGMEVDGGLRGRDKALLYASLGIVGSLPFLVLPSLPAVC